MTFTHALTTGNYGPAKFIVSANVYEGTHTTIAAALTSASSGDTIFIRPGTYTENLTLKAGVNLCAFECDGQTPNVTVIGKMTFTAAGTVSMWGLRLQTNSDFFLSVTGSAASVVILSNCYLNCSNNTGIQYSTSSSSAILYFHECTGNLATTGIAYFSASSAGIVRTIGGYFQNLGLSSTASSFSAGAFYPYMTAFDHGFAFSGTATMSAQFCSWNGAVSNMSAMNITSSQTCGANFCTFAGGTSSAISVGSGSTFQVDFANVQSSNTNAITGLGTIRYGLIVYTGSSSTNNASTQATFTTQPVISAGSGQIVQQIRSSTTSNATTSTAIPTDNTIPQSGEGAQLLTATITPTNASNILMIEFGMSVGVVTTPQMTAAIFQDSTANALAAFSYAVDSGSYFHLKFGRYFMVAGTTSSTQFKLRYGPTAGGTAIVNPNIYGGVCFSSFVVTEIKV